MLILETVLLEIHLEVHVLLLNGSKTLNKSKLIGSPGANDRLVCSKVGLLALTVLFAVFPRPRKQ